MSDPDIANYTAMFIGCALAYGIDTRTVLQPYPNALPEDCQLIGLAIMLHNFNPINQLCLTCLVNEMQKLPYDPVSPFKALQTCGAQQGSRYINGGNSGILILSKHPIRNIVETPIEALGSNRLNVYFTVKNLKFAAVHLAFNLLEDINPSLKPFYYGATQVQMLTDIVKNQPDVIVGDFNTGLDYQPDGYNYIVQNGYKSLSPQPFPTWCVDDGHLTWAPCVNVLALPSSIDHIMIRNTCPSWVVGIFTGVWNTQPLMSDHSGISGRVTKLWFEDENKRNLIKDKGNK